MSLDVYHQQSVDESALDTSNNDSEQEDSQQKDSQQEDFQSTVKCEGPQYNISCEFKNMYWEAETRSWWLFALSETKLQNFEGIQWISKFGNAATINIKRFPNTAEMNQFLQEIKPKKHEGLSLIYSAIWHQNVGHALWDGLYPAYTALVQLGMPFEKYRSVIDIPPDCNDPRQADGKCMSEGIFRTFGGGEWMPMYQNDMQQGWHQFTHAVGGSGRKGARIFNRDLELNGGRELNAAWLFRQRMYKSHGVEPPATRTLSSANRTGPLQGIIVSNKRYTPQSISMMQILATDTKEVNGGAIVLRYIDYTTFKDFAEQLRMLRDVAVHVSGVGTGQCYAPFLPDGSVHVNLGNNGWPGNNDPRMPWNKFGASFMEEYWAEGIPYIRALYYPVRSMHLGISQDETLKLLQQAFQLISSPFSMPVEPGLNLSPIGKTFKEYCYRDDNACDWMLGIMNGVFQNGTAPGKELGDWGPCFMYAWPEMAIMEIGAYNPHGDEDKPSQLCNLRNLNLLRQLRIEQRIADLVQM